MPALKTPTPVTAEIKPPLPPFTLETAKAKGQAAKDTWNSRNPDKVALAYTPDSEWRNRSAFIRQGLRNPAFVSQAVRMALIVGSLVFAINHGKALMQNEMNRDRWLAGALSFVTPYLVSIYGQTQCQLSRSARRAS